MSNQEIAANGNLINTLQERIARFRAVYEDNELATRNQLIHPVLRHMGWDLENQEEVRTIPGSTEANPMPDYSIRFNGQKILFVDVSRMSVDLENREHITQFNKYAIAERIPYGIFTNGAIWLLVRVFDDPTNTLDRVVWKADVVHDAPAALGRKLRSVSKPFAHQLESLVTKTQVLERVWNEMMQDPEPMLRLLLPITRSRMQSELPTYDFEEVELTDLLRERIKRTTRRR